MLLYYTKSAKGRTHMAAGLPCQDSSACCRDERRIIITACDGHGGRLYVRSALGSKFASRSAIEGLYAAQFRKGVLSADKLKLSVLCGWNALVERDIARRPLANGELRDLSEDEKFRLNVNPAVAYGTTLNAAMAARDKLVLLNVGDGGVFLLKKSRVLPAFEDDDETAANFTRSMCQENVFGHMNVRIVDLNEYDGAIVCTDGLLNPYRDLANFERSFIRPVVYSIYYGKYGEVDAFLQGLAEKFGTGDDVSFGLILKSDISAAFYGIRGNRCSSNRR